MDTVEFLRSKGVQPSQQRIRIWEALAATKAHPSADTVHRQLAPEIPTLSRTTVYSTLELFVSLGLAQELEITGSELRYDANASPHVHFACRSCGAVSDVEELDAPSLPLLRDGRLAEKAQLFLTGLCARCAEEASRN